MTIHALEAGDPLTPEAIRKYPTAHPRCGTEFLVVVIALSIIAFGLVGRQDPFVMITSRIVLIPVIAAVGYEILRWGARHRGNPIVRWIMWPGILVQMITTRQPTDSMIEVAIVSMEQALEADGEAVPAGSADLARSPLPPPGTPSHVGAPDPPTSSTESAAPITIDSTAPRGYDDRGGRLRSRCEARRGRPPVRRLPGGAGQAGDLGRPGRGSAASVASWPG
jgi:hypothetical protein